MNSIRLIHATHDFGITSLRPAILLTADRPPDVACDEVVCVPRDIAYDVLMRAEKVRANGKRIFGWVAKGESVHQITKKGGYF